MTHAERKALREKHQPKPWSKDNPYCQDCGIRSSYPCDVIKVLDAYEGFIVPLLEKLPWAYRDWSYEVSNQESIPNINWAGGK